MITGKDFYHILSTVVPLYVAMFLGYASVKWWKIFTPEQCSGVNKFVATFAIPLLSFDFISTFNIYDVNVRFIVADTLQKIVALIALFIWAKFTIKGSLDWSITLFSVTTLPNTLVLGIPLCKSMYGDFSSSLIIQGVFLQVLIWTNFLLILYEYRATIILVSEQFPNNVGSVEVASDVLSLDGREPLETETELGEDGRVHVKLRKSASCNAANDLSRVSNSHRVGFSNAQIYSKGSSFDHNIELSKGIVGENGTNKDLHLFVRSLSTSSLPNFRVGGGSSAIVPLSGLDLHGVQHPKDYEDYGRDQLGFGNRPDTNKPNGLGPPRSTLGSHSIGSKASGPGDCEDRLGANGPKEGPTLSKVRSRSAIGLRPSPISEGEPEPTSKPPARVMAKLILTMVWRKLKWNPNTHASLIGLIWSLISFRLHIKMPEMVAGSIGILSKTGLGMAMFSLGLFMALQPKIIACGKTVATLTMGVRFIVGPLIMAATSLVLGLRGVILQIAIVQAALPQALVPFVFAKEYNLHAQILSTGVIFGMLIFLPFTIAYYILLGLIK